MNGLTEFGLQHPERLLLALFGLFVGVRLVRRRIAGVGWPGLGEAFLAGMKRRDPDRWVRAALRLGAVSALAVCIAGPVLQRPVEPPPELGLDLVLVVDASGSMQAMDTEVRGALQTRLALAKHVVARFARERAERGDRVGLVVFAEHAFTQAPLTRDGAILARALARVEAGVAGEDTALGDALALAVRRVRGHVEGDGEGRVVVLLTDGRNNAGDIPVDVAMELARATSVRVHTVGIGGEGRVPMERADGAAGRGLRFARHDLDAETLAAVAAHTGGRFFRAATARDLESVYAAIDALERVERPAPGRRIETAQPEPWLLAAATLVTFELLGLSALRRPLS